jgi:hypothetical protein
MIKNSWKKQEIYPEKNRKDLWNLHQQLLKA